ncbi:MAG: hypothetical protein QM296_07085 [Bacillota bacterium]|nr:hypothetical protein [Bacillota bacterium]
MRATPAVLLGKAVCKNDDIAPESGNIGKFAQTVYKKVDIALESGNKLNHEMSEITLLFSELMATEKKRLKRPKVTLCRVFLSNDSYCFVP